MACVGSRVRQRACRIGVSPTAPAGCPAAPDLGLWSLGPRTSGLDEAGDRPGSLLDLSFWMQARAVSSPMALTSTRSPESVATVPATAYLPFDTVSPMGYRSTSRRLSGCWACPVGGCGAAGRTSGSDPGMPLNVTGGGVLPTTREQAPVELDAGTSSGATVPRVMGTKATAASDPCGAGAA